MGLRRGNPRAFHVSLVPLRESKWLIFIPTTTSGMLEHKQEFLHINVLKDVSTTKEGDDSWMGGFQHLQLLCEKEPSFIDPKF